MREHRPWRPISRRDLLKGTGAAALAAALGPARRIAAKQTTPTVNISGTELKILQWSHFVPRYDTWFDQFVKDWGTENGVEVAIDHVDQAGIPAAIAAEISAGEGHDLIEFIVPLAQLGPSMLDLTDLVQEANTRHGDLLEMAQRNSFNPTTNTYYGFCHGYAPDPANFRKSLWEAAGLANGPTTFDELLEGGQKIKNDQGIQMGIGMSNEVDSNMAAQAMIWAFGGAVQDENENVVINSPETVAAV